MIRTVFIYKTGYVYRMYWSFRPHISSFYLYMHCFFISISLSLVCVSWWSSLVLWWGLWFKGLFLEHILNYYLINVYNLIETPMVSILLCVLCKWFQCMLQEESSNHVCINTLLDVILLWLSLEIFAAQVG